MLCPRCAHTHTRVIDSRARAAGREVMRRRRCRACAYRWTTFEVNGALLRRQPRKEPRV